MKKIHIFFHPEWDSRKALFYLIVTLFWLLGPATALAQKDEDTSNYIRTGLISFSPDFVLADDNSYIVFTIKNHASRTIGELYGWVYRFEDGKEKDADNFILVNNPHRGGVIVHNAPHRPGKIAQWRFPLMRQKIRRAPQDRYTLRVSVKGLFFPRLEPPPPPKDTK